MENSGGTKVELSLRLDDLYRMTSFIYHDANLGRSRESTLLHFVEVCGMLTLLDRKKKRDRVDIAGALCKALGWYFPLLSKMGVESVERLLFTKYPNVCPYCRRSPHVEQQCKLVRGTEGVLSHDEVRELTDANWAQRPAGLNDWQQMFGSIYPRTLNSTGFSTIALLEELGELAEAVRVFDRYPHYFYGEAADVFSYLMGLANEYEIRCSENDETFNYEREFLARYPGLCIACGAQVCICPTVPPATVGRMAKEMPINVSPITDPDRFDADGRRTAEKVLENVGLVPGLAKYLPYDRGDMNALLTKLAFQLAHALEDKHKDTADRLLKLATELSREKQPSGTIPHAVTAEVLDVLKEAWLKADPAVQQSIETEQPSLGKLTHILETRILVITANPQGENNQAIRLDKEVAEIRQRVKMGTARDRIHIDTLQAATIDNLRVDLLSNNYDIIHFAGHADSNGLELLGPNGVQNLSFDAFGKMLKDQKALKCVVINACSAMQGISTAFAPLVIGMIDDIDDEAALVFAKGFYDAIAAGHNASKAYDVAVTALESEDFDPHIAVKLIG